ncbi:efflux RND transporter periplasmic adaptor subunit [Flammeovirgaceae bacterium SG7u.111]|nr:efflux RND transporter periplasmic adaptor subunit [Flammeovirgaceae bacterium SG7u.132]WPO37066.1 efflux RND transporter periplasmic adaptor subunit [Flammeovirgaceae bacterium SG7u.111]
MKKRYIIPGAIIVALLAVFLLWETDADSSNEITVTVKKSDFEIAITTTGELDPINSVSIRGPRGLRRSGLREFKIEKLIPEGSRVKAGDFIAELDKSELFNKYQEERDQLTKEQAEYTQTKLDTALQLREARDNILNLQFNVEEKEIVLEQSQFEPPATIKQAEIELTKAKRDLKQAKENYEIKAEQARAKMTEAQMELNEQQQDVKFLDDLLSSFTIIAPQNGMVIYTKSWNGKKIREGSTISSWNPEVATLPDLSTMISKTYVNEVDIMKIKRGQPVKIGLDAFPEKKLTGLVTQVANVGEQKPNSDAKVFEVLIKVSESDTTLRPAMTTSNIIISNTVENVLSVPLECLHNQGDSITYVYTKLGIGTTKQQVMVGSTNDNEAVIESGIEEGDEIYLSTPIGMEDERIKLLDGGEAEQVASN